MTNREKLIKTNIYDLLCTINGNMLDIFAFCIMETLPGNYDECIFPAYKRGERCNECIAKWLNEEARRESDNDQS